MAKRKNTNELKDELREYSRQGVELWLNGEPSSAKEILKAHKVAETGFYMRDYVQNSDGEIEKLEFDYVSKHL